MSRPAVSEWIDKNVQTLEQGNAEKAAKFLGVNHRWLNGFDSPMLDSVAEAGAEVTSCNQYKPVIAWGRLRKTWIVFM